MSVKVCYPNYFNDERYAALSASSASSSYPVTNLIGNTRRSKVWQSAGYWVVTSANKVIYFRDASGGADKSATIAEGTYTTTTTFLAAVDTALEAAGLANYTATLDSNFKIVLTSDLSGGATAFELRGDSASFTARDMMGFSASHLTGASTYTATEVRCHTEEFILIDLGSAFNPKAFALFGPRNESLRISSTATIKLQGNATNVWTSPAYETTLTWSEYAIWKTGATGIHTSALRYWRVSIVDRDNARGYIEISHLFLGDIVTLATGAAQFPLQIEDIEASMKESTIGGGSFTSFYGKTSGVSIQWQFLTKSEMESFRDMVADIGVGYPFVIVLDPDEVFSTEMERWVLMVNFDSPPKFQLDRPNQFSTDWSLIEDV